MGSSPTRPTRSAPCRRSVPHEGGLAQLGEHLLCKQGVVGSIPITSTLMAFRCAVPVREDAAKNEELPARPAVRGQRQKRRRNAPAGQCAAAGVTLRGGRGGGERVRTDDPLRARQVLSQLSYTPDKLGGPRRTRTSDLTIISRVL